MTWEQVSARRMARQGLAAPAAGPIADVCRAMVGTHAQVMSAAELSIGLRMDGVTRDDVQRALWTDRTLVKTRGPRGTVHLLPAADLPIWTGALSTLTPADPHRLLTAEQTEQVLAAIAAALADAELTAPELTAELEVRAGSWAGDRVMDAFQDKWPRWMSVMHLAMWRGAMCFGPNRGRTLTYTSPQRWLPGFTPYDAERATSELVRSYLRAYGPATPQQFARWLGAPVSWATERFAGLELEQVDLGWQLAGDPLPEATVSGVRLLPYFDAYGIACQPRELLFPGRASERALAGGQAGNYPLLLIDGVVAGVWHLRRSGRRSTVTVEPLDQLTAARRRALDTEVERIGAFLGGPVELVVGPITVGPHA